MKKHLLLLLTIITSLNAYSQTQYKKGYYIDNLENRIECLIRDIDPNSNSSKVEIKRSEDISSEKLDINEISEFGVYNETKYIRETVNIDQSSVNINHLSRVRYPEFEEKQVFLKVLVEGKANLYMVRNNNFDRFFYNKENSIIEQLVYKQYYISDDKVNENHQFKQQLWNQLKCPSITMEKINNYRYGKKDLVKIFIEYNKCQNTEVVNFEEKRDENLFHVTLRPRYNFSKFYINRFNSTGFDIDVDETTFGIGLEFEYILPFFKKNWSIIVEPTYQYFESETMTESASIAGGVIIGNVDYKSIELPVGFRYHYFFENGSNIFMDAAVIFEINMNSNVEYTRLDGGSEGVLELNSEPNASIGLGYKHKKRLSLELRYLTNRELLGRYAFWDSDYTTLSVIVGYTIF